MKKPPRANGSKKNEKSAVKHGTIADALRRRIVTHQLLPGSQLPTRSNIEHEFGASSVTVQRALDALIEDGFVHATRRRGTFVTDNPPHLTRYGLAFPVQPNRNPAHWTRFWTALSNEAVSMRRPGECEIEFFTGLGVDERTLGSDYHRLENEVRSYRLAGLLLFLDPRDIESLLALDPALPHILVGPAENLIPGEPEDERIQLRLSTRSFVEKSLDYLAQKGRRRIAVISHREPESALARAYFAGAQGRGLQILPQWMQCCGLDLAVAARNITHLLLSAPPHERPDGLIITDDNLVEHTTAGILAAGPGTPEDLDVVGHCNFPWPTPSRVPIKRLGYDARQVLQVGISLLGAARQHGPKSQGGPETLGQTATIEALFDSEIETPSRNHTFKNGKSTSIGKDFVFNGFGSHPRPNHNGGQH